MGHGKGHSSAKSATYLKGAKLGSSQRPCSLSDALKLSMACAKIHTHWRIGKHRHAADETASSPMSKRHGRLINTKYKSTPQFSTAK
eukprot:2988923-Amphidinium_carterae.1